MVIHHLLTVLICQRRWLRLRVRSDNGIGRTVRWTRHVVTTRRGGRVVSLIAHRRDVETLVPETRRVKCVFSHACVVVVVVIIVVVVHVVGHR